MNQIKEISGYTPGYYGKKRQSAATWLESNIRTWSREHTPVKKVRKQGIFPAVCFSRKIGVGALEVADALAEMINYRVIDREILEFMAKDTNLSEKAVQYFDERYPGIFSELFSMLTSEKTFIKSDYSRQLARTATALAGLSPTIFVGRGVHLILPRKEVLAVRFVCSRSYRVERLTSLMKVNSAEASERLELLDKEQRDFFKSVYKKKEALPEEFDLVINMDHIKDASSAAKIVACAFELKFGS
jgi:cytidylate kinase